jgi:hypothetical protein
MAVTIDGQDRKVSSTDLLARPTRRKLRRLGGMLRRRLLGEGGAWVILALVGLVLATLALDWTLRLDRAPRMVVMVVAYVTLAAILWRRLIRPLVAPMNSEALALLVEKANPALESRLISAVQMDADELPAGTSRAMVAAMADEANAMVDSIDVRSIVERRRYWQMIRMALCAVGLIIGLCLWQGPLMKIWAMRNLAFAEVHWPQKTYLAVEQDDYMVLRGDDLDVIVNVINGSEAPAYITVHARYPSVGWTEARVERTDGERQFVVPFPRVSQSFEFYVTGGDDRRDQARPHRVSLVDPPSLRSIAFRVIYPTYTRRADVRIDGSAGMIIVPIGGQIAIDALADKDLEEEAWMTLVGDQVDLRQRIEARPVINEDGTRGPRRRIVGSMLVESAEESSVATLQFHMTDTQGYTNRHGGRYVVRLEADQGPYIEARRFGIGEAITPNAMIPLKIEATDDYGIVLGDIRCVMRSQESDSPIEALEPIEGLSPTLPVDEFNQEVFIDLAERDLQVGQTVSVSVELTDSLPAHLGGPNISTSEVITLRIVSAQDLLAELVLRQKAVRLEFLQTTEQQAAAEGLTEMIIEQLDDPQAILVDADLASLVGRQQTIGADLGNFAERLDAVWQEMTYNRVGQPEDRDELAEEIVEPLRQLGRRSQELAGQLDQARQTSATAERHDQLVSAAAEQEALRRAMEEILERMEQLQSRQDLANHLEMIINWNREIARAIRDQLNAETGNIWEDD